MFSRLSFFVTPLSIVGFPFVRTPISREAEAFYDSAGQPVKLMPGWNVL